MLRRGVKIGIIVGIIIVILIGIAIPIYFNFINKTAYHVTALGDSTDFTAADFANNSELRFYKNGTFHVRIEHEDKGLSLTGIGTYILDNDTYQLTFNKAFARDNDGNIVDYTNHCDEITCVRTGSRIKFTDHKHQIFYFG